jgi:hypothetical protein
MPNWCSNYISVRGTNSAEVKRLADAFDAGELCQAVIPVPEELQIVAGRVGDENNPEQIELERRTAENVLKYGAGNWYDFCVGKWGTKWDVSIAQECDRDEDGLGFNGSFDSAWSPPMGIVEELTERGFEVTLYYYESGMGFVGKYEDGCDDYYDLSDLDSSTVTAAIGHELDDFFGISESMAEYESEQEEEELTEWIKDGAEKRGLVTV